VWAFGSLFAQFKLADQTAVLIYIGALQVIQQFAPLTHHFQKTPARMMVLDMGLEVIREAIYPGGEESHLHLWRSGVALDPLVLRDYVSFLLYGYRHFDLFSVNSKGDILA
jgi:hypothetical protein